MIKCNSSDVFFFFFIVGPPGASSGDFGSEVGQVADDCLTAGMPLRWDGIVWYGAIWRMGYGSTVSPDNDDCLSRRFFWFLFSMSPLAQCIISLFLVMIKSRILDSRVNQKCPGRETLATPSESWPETETATESESESKTETETTFEHGEHDI